MKSALLKPTLLSLAVLTTAVLLGSCAPATSDFGVKIPAPSTSVTGSSSVRKTGTRVPRFPFKAGQVWSISGMDQNRNTLRSQITLLNREPVYRTNTSGRGSWIYEADHGFVALYELEQGTRFVVWDESDPKRLVACYVPATYNDAQSSYDGAALSGSEEEISGTFAKLGNTVLGGSCRATRS